MRNYIIFFFLLVCFFGCQTNPISTPIIENGLAQELADRRDDLIGDLAYHLDLKLSENPRNKIEGSVLVSFQMRKTGDFILDYRSDSTEVISVKHKDVEIPYKHIGDHIVISDLEQGRHQVSITFKSPASAINHRGDYCYTLFVPAKAHYLFPVIDQPSKKGTYQLTLHVPKKWKAISNGKLLYMNDHRDYRIFTFANSARISSYHFAFSAGEFKTQHRIINNRLYSISHREVDAYKLQQLDEIFSQMAFSTEWLEVYTGIPHPYHKNHSVILPGFQYGGMEHPGAIFYKASSLFLSDTTDQTKQLARMKLIAHETAHQWFGNYVTMKWFDEVWVKEVFANYFASKIVEPRFPEIDHHCLFLNTYYPSLYAEDRTIGATPVIQKLENLNQAGLIYGTTIYNKSVIAMNKLVEEIGESNFQKAIKDYLNRYGHGNASWSDLTKLLKLYAPDVIDEWNQCWLVQRGRPTFRMLEHQDTLRFYQYDKWGEHQIWNQSLSLAKYRNFKLVTVDHIKKMSTYKTPSVDSVFHIANSDGKGYGCWLMNEKEIKDAFDYLPHIGSSAERLSLLINLFENVKEDVLAPTDFLDHIGTFLTQEKNPLIFARALSYYDELLYTMQPISIEYEHFLWEIYNARASLSEKNQILSILIKNGVSEENWSRLYRMWETEKSDDGVSIHEHLTSSIAQHLVLRGKVPLLEIRDIQLDRIDNKDRKEQFKQVMNAAQAANSNDLYFVDWLFSTEGRAIEPWAIEMLELLIHPMSKIDKRILVYRTLHTIEQIAQEGDIFFPKKWCQTIFAPISDKGVGVAVTAYVRTNSISPLLKNKILQAADHLL